ncbi:MAG: SGNH/GDSL hydrolase family protein [Alphaproteobacteria bacterium]|nr:SGNH/GDSL hydrolase family protein [Alphaproteobacteria bacterium]
MSARRDIRCPVISRLLGALAITWASSLPMLAEPALAAGPASCDASPVLSSIDTALERSASHVQSGKPLTIVAMGSSSTLGVGASSPAMNYPNRLERDLKDRFPAIPIRVINHGMSGQDVPEELTRLHRDVLAEHPDLVIWQVGTNAVLRRDDLSADEQLIARGVALMKEHRIDVVLMDLQYAPRVLARSAWAEMERVIADIARGADVGLFRRFDIMREWDHTQRLAPAAIIGADGLHMTDASYGCLADQLAEALAWNWWSRAKLAHSPNRNPHTLAGVEGSAGTGPARSAREP